MGKRKKVIMETFEEMAPESPETPVEAFTEPLAPVIYTAIDGDSYASIAANFCPPRYTNYKYALTLMERNKNKKVGAGAVIKL